MKTITKITLQTCETHFQQQTGAILSEEAVKTIFGGTGAAPPNSCYFEALSYLSGYYSSNPAHYSSDDYYNDFSNSMSSGMAYSPSGDFLGVYNNMAKAYAAEYFNTTNLSNGGDIYSYLANNPNGKVMAVVNVSSIPSGSGGGGNTSLTHAYIINGINANGSYNATNASTGITEEIYPSQINPNLLIGFNGER